MEERVIYLSPSAQQNNIGVGDFGSEEYRMNRIADILENILGKKGYRVYRNNPYDTLAQIVEESNRINPNIHVAIHSNAGAETAQGPEIFTNRENTPSDMLANYIYDNILDIYPDREKGRGVKYTTSLYELRETNAPSVLLEVAFHSNEQDAKWIMENEERIAQAIADGIEKFFNDYSNFL